MSFDPVLFGHRGNGASQTVEMEIMFMKKGLLLLVLTLATMSEQSFALVHYYCESSLDGHSAEAGPGASGGFNDAGFIYDITEGYCSRNSEVFRFRAVGAGLSVRMGSFQYMRLTCANEDVIGEHSGVSYSVGAVLNLNGAVFAKPQLSNICKLAGVGNGLGASLTFKSFVMEKVDCNDPQYNYNVKFCRK
jgi:hypothetical protein